METLELLNKRIQSVHEIQSIVTTMKTLAAVNIQHYEQAVEALFEYNKTIEMGFQIALQSLEGDIIDQEPTLDRIGGIVIGSDRGMVGQFNQIVVQHAKETMDCWATNYEYCKILAVGSRVATRLDQINIPFEAELEIPSSISGITHLVQDLLLYIRDWQENKGIDKIVLFHNSPRMSQPYTPVTHLLIPIDPNWLKQLRDQPWSTRMKPFYRLGWQELFAALIREHFFVSLFRALGESLASENTTRLASMQAAESNIQDHLSDLNHQYQHIRQSSITEELLDIISGFEVLSD